MHPNHQPTSTTDRYSGIAMKPLTYLLFLFLLAACSDSNNSRGVNQGKPQADNPMVEGPITSGGAADCCIVNILGFDVDLRAEGLDYMPGTPFYSFLNFDEEEVGYQETEYFISGTATSYIATDELGTDGNWPIQAADAATFRSRIVVQRPIDPADFNGTVIVEWFNVSGGIDAAPDFIQMHTELMREGYAWVGVSAQAAGIEGGGTFGLPLKAVDTERYGNLNHPGDSFAYDIFSQAAQSVRNPAGLDPLEGLEVQRMIGVGQSQASFHLVTYVNAIHPTIDLFDGFLIHSRKSDSAPLSQEPQLAIPTPDPSFIREDLKEPVIILQTETDILQLGSTGSLAARQADSLAFRLWEVAGTAHTDVYTTIKGQNDKGDDPTVADVISNKDARPPFIQCTIPVNDGPGHWVAKAAIAALNSWISEGKAAPSAPLLSVNEQARAFVLDNLGNVRGGIRTPYVDAPVAVLNGEGQPPADPFCNLFGITELFDDATMATLYPDKQTYIDTIDTATDAAVDAGFLRPIDAGLIKDRARTSDIGIY